MKQILRTASRNAATGACMAPSRSAPHKLGAIRSSRAVPSRCSFSHVEPCAVRCSVVARAVKRQLERDFSFNEVLESVVEKLRERKYLSVREMYQLIECIKSPEQAARCLDLIAGFIAARSASIAQAEVADAALVAAAAGVQLTPQQQQQPQQQQSQQQKAATAEADQAAFQADWHHRKRFLARIAEIAVLELQRPELAYAIIGNWQRFRLSTYFGKDLILHLGASGNVPLDVLAQIAKGVQQQRGLLDKGTHGAMQALLQVHQDRGSGADTIAAIKKQLAAMKTPLAQPAKGAQAGQARVRAPQPVVAGAR